MVRRRWAERGGLWRHPDFLNLWAGESVSLIGSQVTLLALPLVAALTLDASPSEMGLLTGAGYASDLAIPLFAGVWVDRRRRRPILIQTDLARCLLLATVPLAAALGVLTLAHLIVVALLFGACTVLFGIAYGAYLPSLIPREHLVEGNGKLELSKSVASVVGPGLAGGLVRLLTAPFALTVDAISFLVSAFFLRRIRQTELDVIRHGERQTLWREIGQGLRFVFGHPILRPLSISAGLFNFFGVAIGTLYVLYATDDLGIGAGTLGLILSIGAPGALVGAVLAPRVTARVGVGPAMIGGMVISGLASLLIPAAALVAPIPMLVGQGWFFGIGAAVYGINMASIGQAVPPPHLMGRARASQRFLWGGTLPLGALIGGAAGEAFGVMAVLVTGAVGTSLAGVYLVFTALRGLRQLPDHHDDALARDTTAS